MAIIRPSPISFKLLLLKTIVFSSWDPKKLNADVRAVDQMPIPHTKSISAHLRNLAQVYLHQTQKASSPHHTEYSDTTPGALGPVFVPEGPRPPGLEHFKVGPQVGIQSKFKLVWTFLGLEVLNPAAVLGCGVKFRVHSCYTCSSCTAVCCSHT